jgi:uncharacterized protein (DUF1330 family)
VRSKAIWLMTIAGLVVVGSGTTYLAAAAGAGAPKGYVIAELTVTDPEGYKQYAAAVPPIIAKFGGKYLVRGGQTVGVEGDPPGGRIVVIEFDSLAAARSFEESNEYQAITELRHRAARGRVFLAEGIK